MEHYKVGIPSRKELRNFGFLSGAFVPALFGIVVPWFLAYNFPLWPWILGALFAIAAAAWPPLLRPVHRGILWVGDKISRVTTPLILGLVFFIVITPMALTMRLFRRDPMARRTLPHAKSYRVTRPKPPKDSILRPF